MSSMYPFYNVARLIVRDEKAFRAWHLTLPYEVKTGNVGLLVTLACEVENIERLSEDVRRLSDETATILGFLYEDGSLLGVDEITAKRRGYLKPEDNDDFVKVARIDLTDIPEFEQWAKMLSFPVRLGETGDRYRRVLCTRQENVAALRDALGAAFGVPGAKVLNYFNGVSTSILRGYNAVEEEVWNDAVGVSESHNKEGWSVGGSKPAFRSTEGGWDDHVGESNTAFRSTNNEGVWYQVVKLEIQDLDALIDLCVKLEFDIIDHEANEKQVTLCTHAKNIDKLYRAVKYIDKKIAVVAGYYFLNGQFCDFADAPLGVPLGCLLQDVKTRFMGTDVMHSALTLPPPRDEWYAVVRLRIKDEDTFMALTMSLGYDIITTEVVGDKLTLCTQRMNVSNICRTLKESVGPAVAEIVALYCPDGALYTASEMPSNSNTYHGCPMDVMNKDVTADERDFFKDLKNLGIGLPGTPYLNTLGCRLCVLENAKYLCDPCGCIAFCEEHMQVYLQSRWKSRCPTCCRDGITFIVDGDMGYKEVLPRAKDNVMDWDDEEDEDFDSEWWKEEEEEDDEKGVSSML